MMVAMLLAGVAPHGVQAAERIRIAGSSTVYPFSASVAEHFGKVGDFPTPVVEATGTGAGMKLFCENMRSGGPDIVNASRQMLPTERAQCDQKGVRSVVEVKLGFDGITLANTAQKPRFSLTRKELFLALAHDVPAAKGGWQPNPYQRWNQINPVLPDQRIRVYGMPPVSGTRDTFVELVMEKGCETVLPAQEVSEKERKLHCRMIREDGAFIEAGENGNLIVQKLLIDEDALGILGFSFLDQNHGRIQASLIENHAPSFESIQSGSYVISRPLFMYVNGEHAQQVPGIAEFVQEFLSEGAAGDEGYLVVKGLIPLPEQERARNRAVIMDALKPAAAAAAAGH